MAPDRPHSPASGPLILLLLLVASCGIGAIWALISLSGGKQNGWMAVIAALDAIWLLRLCRVRAGPWRAAGAVLATAIAVAFANWSIAAIGMGIPLGLGPWDAFVRLGAGHAWTLIWLANSAQDLAWIGAALVVAAVLGR
ncbi:hypothetical protein [Luteimonas aquatica]|uniref:hypothetical protein n=1 Tax=Luteimonas aquatica TaxID=450364 RepID=UPI001F55C252|nr:hypothetical protein [Luteimonas aquatica]